MSLSELRYAGTEPLDDHEAAVLKELYISVDEWPDNNLFYNTKSETEIRLRHAFGFLVELEKSIAESASHLMLDTVTVYTSRGLRGKESMIAYAKSFLKDCKDDADRQELLKSIFFLTEFLNGKSMRKAAKAMMISDFDSVINEVNFYLGKQ